MIFDTVFQDLVVILDDVCSDACLTQGSREVNIAPSQLWNSAKFHYFGLSTKEVNNSFVEAVEEYSTLVMTYKSAIKNEDVSITCVEKFVINEGADGLSATITHTHEYFDYLVKSRIHGNV